jgi:uncharacterized protein YbjT (DUF2867 family)
MGGSIMIVITGATGSVGREAVELLVAAGFDVAAVTRDAARASMPAGVRVVEGDPSRPETLAAAGAWDGVEAVLISPRASSGATAELLADAAAHGAKRVVVISAATLDYPAGEPRFAEEFRAVEQAAEASGLGWTSLRCADFDANALAWAPQVRATGTVRGAYAAAATSPIHSRDIAAVAVKALISAGHEGQRYVLTGPRSLTQPAKAALLGAALDRPVEFVEVAPEQVRAGLLAQGLPAEIPDRLLGSLADYARAAGPTTDTVERLLGRPALDFAGWAAENVAAFRQA